MRTLNQIMREQRLEKRVRSMDADDIVEWIVKLEDISEGLKGALEEARRIMKNEREMWAADHPEDESTLDTYDSAIKAADAAVEAWGNGP